MGGAYALLAALGFTIFNILVRKGLVEENPGGIWEIRLISSLATLGFFFIIVLISILLGFSIMLELTQLSLIAVLVLILSGVLGTLIGALCLSIAIGQIGASRTTALFGGSNPLFSALFAVLFLGEIPSLIGLIAVFIIVFGIIIVSYHSHLDTIMLLEKTKISGGLIAILSGLFYALSQIGRGAALHLGATQNTAFFVHQSTALIITAGICLIKNKNLKYLKYINRYSIYCYVGAGIGGLIGCYSILIAFNLIPVWEAVAISNVQPLLAIILSWILLKKIEKVNMRLVLGAILVTLGVILLNVY